ncbi:peptidoglycan/LPS O-acetylase OafA/YrhL [Bradyrhizobium sp. GM5.1]
MTDKQPLFRPAFFASFLHENRYPEIDGIRAFAAFLVFLVHALGATPFIMGWNYASFTPTSDSLWVRVLYFISDGDHGVDIFFIISGFLMGRLVLAGRQSFSYTGFIARRGTRIYPAFLISLIASAAYNCTMLAIYGWQFDLSIFIANIFFVDTIYWDKIRHYNHVSWSLGFEFAFYLALPFYLVGAKLVGKRLFATIVIAAYMPLSFHEHLISTRFLGLLVGVMIATFDDFELSNFAYKMPMSLLIGAYLTLTIGKGFWAIDLLTFQAIFPFVAALLLVRIVFRETARIELPAIHSREVPRNDLLFLLPLAQHRDERGSVFDHSPFAGTAEHGHRACRLLVDFAGSLPHRCDDLICLV